MKVTVLSENTTKGPHVMPEFGLSMHIERGKTTVLFDSGGSDNFARNAQALGIDLAAVDVAVLSHGHFDHADGFGAFFAANDRAPIYAHAGFDGDYYKGNSEYIGIAQALKGNSRFKAVDGPAQVADGLRLLSYDGDTAKHGIEPGDMKVKDVSGMRSDDFAHEHYLLASEGDVRLLVTGCSHRGIANIMSWTRGEGITHVVGGFHLMGVQPRDYGKLDALADELLKYDVCYYTCHCTGIDQYAYLKGLMGDRLIYLGTGDVLSL